MKMPAMQFYPADWKKDLGVQSLGYFDRGVWFEMICLMHESSERGVLSLNGKAMSEEMIANHLGLDNQTFNQTLTKLLDYGVAKRRESDNAIFNKRMVDDEKLCKIRREAGKKGGNPNLLNQNSNQVPNQTPTPSSSSSTSLKTSPIPPKDEKADRTKNAIALKTYIKECKAVSIKPIPDEDTVFDYAQKAGIPSDFLWLQWKEFIDRYCAPDAKRYKDWRAVFRKSVRSNWFKLWYIDGNGQYALTTVGVQAQNIHKGKAA